MIGTDIVEVSRFREMKNLEMFIRRVFTENEAKYFSSKGAAKHFYESVAGHFAAKEAFAKALGTGVRGFEMSDIEICHDELGKPYICFGGIRVRGSVSISHSESAAIAVVYLPDEREAAAPIYADIGYYSSLLPVRRDDANKGDCGKILIVGGSRGMIGAPCLAAMGAMRSGSGLVTVAVPKGQQPIAAAKLTEAMTVPLEELADGTLSLAALGEIKSRTAKSDVCVFGPGLSRNDDIAPLLDSLLSGSCDMVIDADGLNAISENLDILRKHKNRRSCSAVITPHPGEMARLCDISVSAVQNNRTQTAKDFAEEFGVTVVLKGSGTVIASPSGKIRINRSGNSAMATGGMGDVLSGMIASYMGQGLEPFDAAVLGVFIHGAAGDLAKKDIGSRGILASDLAKRIPAAARIAENADTRQ